MCRKIPGSPDGFHPTERLDHNGGWVEIVGVGGEKTSDMERQILNHLVIFN